MKIKYFLVSIIILTFSSIFSQEKKEYKVNTIAFYNLENLFDTENDPLTFDDDRTPDGKDHWTEEIYQVKLENMAKVIAEIGADISGTTPAIIGVCEIENRKVLEDLVNQEPLFNLTPPTVEELMWRFYIEKHYLLLQITKPMNLLFTTIMILQSVFIQEINY